jgi:UDP-N-acetylmuramate--alanine ligase
LHLYPTLAVVTNIDLEHLDIYKDIDDIKQTFKSFLSNIPFYGKAIICTDDKNIESLLPITHVKTVTYGIDRPAEWTAKNIVLEGDHSLFDLYHETKQICRITINMPGKHNVLNALASIAITHELGIPIQDISTALATFKGVERRFTYKGLYKDAEFFDDYGHHPTEIDKTLLVARKRSQGKLIVIFEPHRYSRTEKLWSDFLTVFKQGDIDHLIITDIYSAGEQPLENITSKKLVEDIQALHPKFSVTYAPQTADFSSVKAALEPLLQDTALVLTLGAGKITHFYNSLIKE